MTWWIWAIGCSPDFQELLTKKTCGYKGLQQSTYTLIDFNHPGAAWKPYRQPRRRQQEPNQWPVPEPSAQPCGRGFGTRWIRSDSKDFVPIWTSPHARNYLLLLPAILSTRTASFNATGERGIDDNFSLVGYFRCWTRIPLSEPIRLRSKTAKQTQGCIDYVSSCAWGGLTHENLDGYVVLVSCNIAEFATPTMHQEFAAPFKIGFFLWKWETMH